MTEAEWDACENPWPMLESIGAGDRKVRLFACACCRRVMTLLSTTELVRTLNVAERFAEGLASADECRAASREAYKLYSVRAARGVKNIVLAVSWAAAVSETGTFPFLYAAFVFENACRLGEPWNDGEPLSEPQRHERINQSALLRDIFGNPFRPVTFCPAWRTSTATAIAQQMYESRDFGAMPTLADALQDAGCDSDDILDHCRGPGPHVRGCWVVDLVLGKE